MIRNGDAAESETNLPKPRPRWLAPALWVTFAVGLLVQDLSPRLKIERNAFVMPPALIAQGKEFRPDEIVARERRMQLLSGLLTVGSAIGLALCYRQTLFKRRSP